MENKEFDIVVFGASGFTGRLVAEYLSQTYGNGATLTWAMAGRNQHKLETVRDDIGAPANTPIVIADVQDQASIDAMVGSAKVVITTTGPYQLYGSGLVAACAKLGADYVDLCGEPVWMRQMIDAHHKTAQQTGARIVFSCGFDSIPSDLGVYYLQQIAQRKTGQPCQQIQGRIRALKGTFSGGTAASLRATLAAAKKDPEYHALLINHYAMVPGFDGVEQPSGTDVHFDESLQSWVAPFVMAAINTRVLHRSNYLLDFAYGKDFIYDEMMLTGSGEHGEQTARFVADNPGLGGKDDPKPGEGPSKEERENGFFDIIYIGKQSDGESITVSVKGDKDPGYGSTCGMLAESAICLIRDSVDTSGGIWTPSSAMGDNLIERLQSSGVLMFDEE